MFLFRPLKYLTNVTESEVYKSWKIWPDKTLDIDIVKLLSCIETLFY